MTTRPRGLLAVLLGVALALVAALGVVPREALADGTKAYAAYDVTTDENKGKSGADLEALRVTFNGKQWYVIEDNSTAPNAGTLTLLAADNVATGQAFRADMSSNKYSESDVIGVLKAMTETGDFKDVAGAIVTIGSLTTEAYSENEPYYEDGTLYDTATSVKLYLLSTREANAVPENVRKAGYHWWLRSPGDSQLGVVAAYVYSDGDVGDWGAYVDAGFGVRPALKLNLESVIFESKTFSLPVDVTDVTLDPTASVEVGKAVTLSATVEPDDASYKTVTWSSSDEGVATVEDGVVTGVKAGKATITCTATNGTDDTKDDVSATCEVTVTAPEPEPTPTPTDGVALTGSGHVQKLGDVAAKASGKGIEIGTTGEAKRLEQLTVSLPKDTNGGIEYRAHLQGKGWGEWVEGGKPCGTTHESRRIEAVQLRLTGALAKTHSVWYRVHSQTFGWLGWAQDGQAAGTAGQAKRAEAIDVQVLPQGEVPEGYVEREASYVGAAKADVHVQRSGWAGARSALEFGTTGQSRRLEAIRLSVPSQPLAGGISYEVHAQGKGWMPAAADGALAGTTGQSRRLEAVRVSLTGDMAREGGYSVWYRVHSQTYGWLGWAHDGEPAGTTGLSKRAEAIDVQVLPQGQVPRGYDASKAACVSK